MYVENAETGERDLNTSLTLAGPTPACTPTNVCPHLEPSGEQETRGMCLRLECS